MTKFFGYLLGVEFLVAGAAPVIFTAIENRLHAGLVAGSLFTALGLFIVGKGVRDRSFRRMPTFWAGCLHLFGSALPMLITRLMNLSRGFEDVLVLGMPAPVFHGVSTKVFAILMIATAFDLVRSWRTSRASSGKVGLK